MTDLFTGGIKHRERERETYSEQREMQTVKDSECVIERETKRTTYSEREKRKIQHMEKKTDGRRDTEEERKVQYSEGERGSETNLVREKARM